jgi:hypothetical protein
MSGRTLPAVLTLVPVDKPREKTVVVYDKITFDLSLNNEVFSIRNLQK